MVEVITEPSHLYHSAFITWRLPRRTSRGLLSPHVPTMADAEIVTEPLNIKEDRGAHHARDRAHKPGDRAKKFSAKSQPKGALLSARNHKKARQGHFMKPAEVERTANPDRGHFAVKEGVIAAGVRDEVDGDIGAPSSGDDAEGETAPQLVDAEGTPRMVARDVPLEDLLAAAVKKPKKPRGERNGLCIGSLY